MSQKEIISTDKSPAAIGPYSQAVCFDKLVFTSGQIAMDPASGNIPADFQAQAVLALQNLGGILEAAGSSYDKVLKVTCFLASMSDFAVFNEEYAKCFQSKPARSCVAVKTLPKNVLVEIEAIAYRD